MANLWMVLPWIVAAAVVIVIAPVVVGAYLRYRDARTVRCPTTGTDAVVEVDAVRAARTAFPGPPDVRVKTCSHWPDLDGCDETCVRPAPAREAELN